MAAETACFLCKKDKKDPLTLWPCTHVFCRDCLSTWEPKHSLRLHNDSTCVVCPQCNQLALMQGSLDRFPRSTSLCNASTVRDLPPNSPMLCRDEVRSRLREARCRLEQRQEAVFDSMAVVRRRIPEVHQEGKEKKEEVRLFIAAIQEELIKRQHYLYEQIDEAVEQAESYCHQRTEQLAENTSLLANYTEGLSDLMNRTYKDRGSSCELELTDFLSGVEQVCATAATTPDERIPLDTPKSFKLPPVNVSVLVDSAVFDGGVDGVPPGQRSLCASQTCLSASFKARPPRHLRPLFKDLHQKNASASASQPSTPSPSSWRETPRTKSQTRKGAGTRTTTKRRELKKRPGSAPLAGDALPILSDISQVDCQLARSSSMQVLCSSSDHYSSTSTYNSPMSDSRDNVMVGTADVKVKMISVQLAPDSGLPSRDCNEEAGRNIPLGSSDLCKEAAKFPSWRTRHQSFLEELCNLSPPRKPSQRLLNHPYLPMGSRVQSQQEVIDMKRHIRATSALYPLREMQQLHPVVSLPGSTRPVSCLFRGHDSNSTARVGPETQRKMRPRGGELLQAGDFTPSQHAERRHHVLPGNGNNDEFGNTNWSSNTSPDKRLLRPTDKRLCRPIDFAVGEATHGVTEFPATFEVASGDATQSNASETDVTTKSTTTFSVEEDIQELSSECRENDQLWSGPDIPYSTCIVLTSKLPADSKTDEPALSQVPEITDLRAIYQPQPRTIQGSRPGAASVETIPGLDDSSLSEIVYPLDGDGKVGSIRRKQLSADDAFLLSASSYDSLSRLRTCKSTPGVVGECLMRSGPKKDMVIDWKVTISERGPIITISWQKVKGAEQYKISIHDLDLVECDSKGLWRFILGGSYLHEIFTSEVKTLLTHVKFDHCYAVSVMAIGPGGAPVATSYTETVRTPRRVRFEHVEFDPLSCHPTLSVDASRRSLIHRKSPFSFCQEKCVVEALKTMPGSLACQSFPTDVHGLDLIYWECRVNIKIIRLDSQEEPLCTIGICQANSVDKEKTLSKNRRSLCCVFSQDELEVVLQFWDGWRPAVGLSDTKVRLLEKEHQREASIGLGFFLAFSRRAFVVVDSDRDVVLHEFRLPKRQVKWSLATSLHNQARTPTSLTWLHPLTLPSCLLPVAR